MKFTPERIELMKHAANTLQAKLVALDGLKARLDDYYYEHYSTLCLILYEGKSCKSCLWRDLGGSSCGRTLDTNLVEAHRYNIANRLEQIQRILETIKGDEQ